MIFNIFFLILHLNEGEYSEQGPYSACTTNTVPAVMVNIVLLETEMPCERAQSNRAVEQGIIQAPPTTPPPSYAAASLPPPVCELGVFLAQRSFRIGGKIAAGQHLHAALCLTARQDYLVNSKDTPLCRLSTGLLVSQLSHHRLRGSVSPSLLLWNALLPLCVYLQAFHSIPVAADAGRFTAVRKTQEISPIFGAIFPSSIGWPPPFWRFLLSRCFRWLLLPGNLARATRC